MILNERDEQASAATAEEVRAVRLNEGLFPRRLQEHLLQLLGATSTVVYSLRSADEVVEVDELSAVTPVRPGQVREALDANLRTEGRQGPFIQLRPPVRQRNRALLLSQLVPDRAKLRLTSRQAGLHRVGLEGLDQVRILVCEGATLKAFVGAYREEPFTARHRSLLMRLQPTLVERTRVLSMLPQAELSFTALRTVFENTATATGLVDSRGDVVMGNPRLLASALTWRQELRAALAGDPSVFAVTPVDAVGLPRHYLVRRLAQGGRVTSAFARKYALTPRETEVLEHVASGRSNAAIAALLVCSVRTAETHVSHLLAKTRAGSRTEVIDLLLREST